MKTEMEEQGKFTEEDLEADINGLIKEGTEFKKGCNFLEFTPKYRYVIMSYMEDKANKMVNRLRRNNSELWMDRRTICML